MTNRPEHEECAASSFIRNAKDGFDFGLTHSYLNSCKSRFRDCPTSQFLFYSRPAKSKNHR
jgi:hypothetical protein